MCFEFSCLQCLLVVVLSSHSVWLSLNISSCLMDGS